MSFEGAHDMFCSLHTHSLFCDGTCSLEEMARAAADAGLVSFSGCGHYSFLDNPIGFRAVVASFLNSLKDKKQ